MTTAISASGLVKAFGQTRALDGLDLSVATGEVHGFLGPNGPGGDLHRGRREGLLGRLALDPTRKGRAYSKGNRQKVALVAALASDAELLILDEPTSGLDPLMEAVFQDTIKEITDDGRTVLLSSHILAEVEALCDRVSIIRLGRTVESGTLAELRHLTRTSIAVETERPIDGRPARGASAGHDAHRHVVAGAVHPAPRSRPPTGVDRRDHAPRALDRVERREPLPHAGRPGG